MYQYDEARGLRSVCEEVDGSITEPEQGPAVLVVPIGHMFFHFFPGGEWYVKVDALMPDQASGAPGQRIFCVEGTKVLR